MVNEGQKKSPLKSIKVTNRYFEYTDSSLANQMFQVGDIVQVQLSFIVIPVKAGRRKMLTII